MRIKNVLIYFLISICIISCHTKNDRSALIQNQQNMENDKVRKGEIFCNFIKNKLKLSISNELHYYILVPKFGCEGCMIQTLVELDTLIDDRNKSMFTIISTNNDIIPDRLFETINIIEDTAKSIERINIGLANVTLIEAENGKVNFIQSIKLSDLPIRQFIKGIN